jgi:hypothetical protein
MKAAISTALLILSGQDPMKAAVIAKRRLREAEEVFKELFRAAFPVGSTCRWTTERNGKKYVQTGIVLDNNPYSATVKVRNLRTDVERWIDSYDLLKPYTEDKKREIDLSFERPNVQAWANIVRTRFGLNYEEATALVEEYERALDFQAILTEHLGKVAKLSTPPPIILGGGFDAIDGKRI